MKFFAAAGQVVLLAGVFLLASALARTTGWSISAGVLGLFAVLVLLLTGVLDVRWVGRGASWLLNELVLFFIPAVVAIVQHFDLFRTEGLRLIVAIAAGTLLVMTCTALAVHAGTRLERRLARGHAQR